jgi:hypothetical protein
MRTRLKQAARWLFDALGVEMRRKSALPTDVADRQTLQAVLTHAASIGFSPVTVIHAGAAEGTVTRARHRVFPSATYVLVESLVEHSGSRDPRLGTAGTFPRGPAPNLGVVPRRSRSKAGPPHSREGWPHRTETGQLCDVSEASRRSYWSSTRYAGSRERSTLTDRTMEPW